MAIACLVFCVRQWDIERAYEFPISSPPNRGNLIFTLTLCNFSGIQGPQSQVVERNFAQAIMAGHMRG